VGEAGGNGLVLDEKMIDKRGKTLKKCKKLWKFSRVFLI
jgi:hypothetical protein